GSMAVVSAAERDPIASSLDRNRIAAIAAMLPDKPAGVGRPVSDREAWQALAAKPAYQSVVDAAANTLKDPLPEVPEELYLDYSRTGNRTRWQAVNGRRLGRIPEYVLAECIENKGRFLAAFEALAQSVCEQRTWVMPAHDGSLVNFKGTRIDIDLGSSAIGWNLATADFLLGDRISPETRRLIRENVNRRILAPFRDMVEGKRGANSWLSTTNNWNAVCLANVTGAALTLTELKADRAFFVAAAEHLSLNFLKGFTSDGYCSEGLGYWNYGFGHYVLLAETVRQATGGKLDLLERPVVRAIALFGVNIEITNGICPAFADCSTSARPSARILSVVSRELGLGLSRWESQDPASPSGGLAEAMVYSFPSAAGQARPAAPKWNGPGSRTWFEQAGILVCRPIEGSVCRMGVALKGGHNAEHHNHNDVGSYVVVIGKEAVLVDPGAEVYTARTFSNRRYQSKVLNSFGHPVPKVADELQQTGSQARGKVVKTEFTDASDTLVLDLASAYRVPSLKKLERTFVYSRFGTGSLTVTDEVLFSQPARFGTALITFGKWERRAPDRLVISSGREAARIVIEVTGGEWDVFDEPIEEDLGVKRSLTRLGIDFKNPVKQGKVVLTILPATDAQ
ncbi:MAG TPA: heparinase II/III family protein, partial [Phycisphaerae bacterium]|nr:heparinase II/III family protein [Phycisphaerae bacterium]